jgi:hypothetical protein
MLSRRESLDATTRVRPHGATGGDGPSLRQVRLAIGTRRVADAQKKAPATRHHVSVTAVFTKAGSIVTPRPGPVGTVSTPLTLRKVEESDATGSDVSRPLYS